MTNQQRIELATATAKRTMGVIAFEKMLAGEPWPHATVNDRKAMELYFATLPPYATPDSPIW